MKKEILFTFALLLFSKNTITMNPETKVATVTIKFTKKGYKDDYEKHKGLSNIIDAKLKEQGLSEQETKTIYIVDGEKQLNNQLGEEKLPKQTMATLFGDHGDMAALLEIKEKLSLEITYTAYSKGKNIKRAKK